MNDKIIVTNLSALRAKYGSAGWNQINTAVKALIAADKARGLTTRLIDVGNASAMKSAKGHKVTKTLSAEQNKAAIDAIYRAYAPAYLLILGAVDVIPHQDLRNPVFGGDDPDPLAYGDIPYACEAPYSQEPKDFIGPTRVLGRLPDLVGAKDPRYLVDLLGTAAQWRPRDPSDYASYFAISAAVWKKSTALSVQKLFGADTDLQLVPPRNYKWSNALLGARAHFINCHGGQTDPQFYGQKGNSYPVSHLASYISGKITEGTVAAVECCYGAELYDPGLAGGQAGICSTYLASKAYGYFGSSTIAYGPSDGNGAADLLCQYFLRRVKAGASLGRAALEARQEFAGGAPEIDPIDLKTLAQFQLLGDPSITPVETPVVATAGATPKGMASLAKSLRIGFANAAVARADRRRQLLARGIRIAATQAVVAKVSPTRATGTVFGDLKKIAASLGMSQPKFLSGKIDRPAAAARAIAPALIKMMPPPGSFHVMTERKEVPEVRAPQIIAVVAKEQAGRIVSYRELHSR